MNFPSDFEPFQETARDYRKPKDRVLRFFRRSSAERVAFAKFSEAKKLVLQNSVATRDEKLTFIKNSKAGCTAVANLLYRYDHGVSPSQSVHGLALTRVLQIPAGSFVFSTVRRPTTRIVSGFFNLIVTGENENGRRHLPQLTKFGYFDKDDLHYRFDVFLDYLAATFAVSELRADVHFRQQHLNIGHGLIALSDIAKLETLAIDLDRIRQRSGVDFPDLKVLTVKQRNPSGSEAFKPNSSQVAKIEALYEQDFELYGY